MTVHQARLQLETSGQRDMHDITSGVQQVVSESRISAGVVHVFNVGSTACVGTIEFEPGLQEDLPDFLHKLAPPSRDYGHERTWNDGNGHSHLQATLMGPEISIPISGGQLILGTWQQVFHLECDIKPRRREIVITVMGD